MFLWMVTLGVITGKLLPEGRVWPLSSMASTFREALPCTPDTLRDATGTNCRSQLRIYFTVGFSHTF